jgi:hypothetical protein
MSRARVRRHAYRQNHCMSLPGVTVSWSQTVERFGNHFLDQTSGSIQIQFYWGMTAGLNAYEVNSGPIEHLSYSGRNIVTEE